jgi:hypothetical protein
MKAAAEDNDIRPAGGVFAQLDSSFYSFRTAVAEEEAVQGRRHDSLQLPNQLQHRLMVDEQDLPVD